MCKCDTLNVDKSIHQSYHNNQTTINYINIIFYSHDNKYIIFIKLWKILRRIFWAVNKYIFKYKLSVQVLYTFEKIKLS